MKALDDNHLLTTWLDDMITCQYCRMCLFEWDELKKYDLRIYVFVGVEWLLSTLGGVLIGGDAVLRIGGGGCSVGTTWEHT